MVQRLLKRLILFLLSPILIFVFGEQQQRPLGDLTGGGVSTSSSGNGNGKGGSGGGKGSGSGGFDINAHLSPYRARDNISVDLFNELEELARIVDISYCVGYSGIKAPFKCLSRCEEFPSFQLIGTWNTGPYLADSCGYVALSHPPAPKRIIMAFRGTYSLSNAIADLSLGKQEYLPYPSDGHSTPSMFSSSSNNSTDDDGKCEDCAVHSGFLESWRQAEKLIGETVKGLVEVWKKERGYELVLVGHSLGGAVAALAGLEFVAKGYGPIVTTFGEPKIGNEALANYLNNRFTPATYRRVTHVDDPIPLLPLNEWGFSAHKTEYYITKPDTPPSPRDVLQCEGNDDKECVAGGKVNVLQLFWAHRDYFHRLGVCLPDLRRIWDETKEAVKAEGEKEEGKEEEGKEDKGGEKGEEKVVERRAAEKLDEDGDVWAFEQVEKVVNSRNRNRRRERRAPAL
ncbi:Alpha/Beta hydrolase protein [Peziza echinospora]|nr:Alpha/Beta hydrolase protein [Peziza echinospora]